MKIIVLLTIVSVLISNDSFSHNIDTNSNFIIDEGVTGITRKTIDTFYVNANSNTEIEGTTHVILTNQKESFDFVQIIILPVIMLILGVLIDRGAEIRITNKKMRKNGNRWRYELLSLTTPIKNQITNIENFIKIYCNDPLKYDIPLVQIDNLLKGDIFDSFNKEDLYDFLECQKSTELDSQERYNRITSFVRSLAMIYDTLFESFNNFKSSASNEIESFNQKQLEYSQTLLSSCSIIPKTTYDKLVDLFDCAFASCPNVNLFNIEESFVNESLNVLKPLDKQTVKDLNNSLLFMRQRINGLKLEKYYIEMNLKQVIDLYQQCLEVLPKLQVYFPNSKKIFKKSHTKTT